MTDPVLAFNHPQGHGRFYRHPRGMYQAVPSITNVMKRQNKPAINGSNVRKAAEWAVANRDRLVQLTPDEQVKLIKGSQYEKSEASIVGDIVHDWIDRYVKATMGIGSNPPTHDEVAQSINSARWTWESFIKFVKKFSTRGLTFTASEFTVWSNKYGYAGTGDLAMTINGQRVLADTKTGKSVYPETAMQLAALANADFMFDAEGTEVPIPHYDRFAVLHLRPRSARLVPMDNIPAAWDTFLALKRVFDWEMTYAMQTVGAAPQIN